MSNKRTNLEELLQLKKERTKQISICKSLIKNFDYNQITAWADTLNEKQILLFIGELCVDDNFEKEFKILKGYYLNKYTND